MSSAWSLRASSASASTSTVGGGGGGGGGAAREARVARPPPPPLPLPLPPREEDISLLVCAFFLLLLSLLLERLSVGKSCWEIGVREEDRESRGEVRVRERRRERNQKQPPSASPSLVCRRRPICCFSIAKKRARASFSLRCFLLQQRAGPRTPLCPFEERNVRARAPKREGAGRREEEKQKKASSFSRHRAGRGARRKNKSGDYAAVLADGRPCVVLDPSRD